MAQPESELISAYRWWRIFGTGTFAGQVPSLSAQKRLVFAFLYRSAKILDVPFGGLVWCTRREHGELGGRVHYHWLIGASRLNPTIAHCFMLNAAWDSLPRCGFSRNRLFQSELNGVEYVTKCLGLPDAALRVSSGGDYYEAEKFGHGSAEVTVSNTLACVVRGARVGALTY